MKKWAQRLNYINSDGNDKWSIYHAIYHGKNRDLHYIGKSQVNLKTRWQHHHENWSKYIDILPYCDILAAVSEPEDWDIEVVDHCEDKKGLNELEDVYINGLLEVVDANDVLNLVIPRIPTRYLTMVKRREKIWYPKISRAYPLISFRILSDKKYYLVMKDIALYANEGRSIGSYDMPIADPKFYYFNDEISLQMFVEKIPDILARNTDSTLVNLDLRYDLFLRKFSREIHDTNIKDKVLKIKELQGKKYQQRTELRQNTSDLVKILDKSGSLNLIYYDSDDALGSFMKDGIWTNKKLFTLDEFLEIESEIRGYSVKKEIIPLFNNNILHFPEALIHRFENYFDEEIQLIKYSFKVRKLYRGIALCTAESKKVILYYPPVIERDYEWSTNSLNDRLSAITKKYRH